MVDKHQMMVYRIARYGSTLYRKENSGRELAGVANLLNDILSHSIFRFEIADGCYGRMVERWKKNA